MSLTPFALLILALCPLAWTVLDLLRKRLAEHGRLVAVTALMTAALVPPTLIWLVVDGGWRVAAGYWLPGLVALVLNVAANLAYMRSVALSPLSATIPLLSLTPVFATLLGIPLLGEVPSASAVAGIPLVVFGALALNSDPELGLSPLALLRAALAEKGSLWMALVAILWSVTPLLDKIAVGHASMPMHALVQTGGITVVLVLWLALRGRLGNLGVWRETRLLTIAAGVVGIVALGIQLVAIQLVWVGLVETLKRGVGSVMALVFGYFLLDETIPTRRLLAVALMVVGVWLVLA